MAGRKIEQRFFSPAHFQVIRPKEPFKQPAKDDNLKLKPPGQFGVPKKKDPEPKITEDSLIQKEVDSLREETRRLKDLLKIAKNRELELEEDCRKSKAILQRSRVGDAIDLRRLAEVEEENTVLQSEARKQKAVISKLKSDINHNREQYETETEKLETEINNYSTSIRQLKQEIKDKDLKYENDVESLQKRCKKQSFSIKELKSELQKAQEQIEIDRAGFESVIGNSESQKYKEVKRLEEALTDCESRYSRELMILRESLSEKDKVIEVVQTGIAEKDAEIKQMTEDTDKKERAYVEKITKYSSGLEKSQASFEERAKEFQNALQECMVSNDATLKEQNEKIKAKDKQLRDEQAVVEQLRTYIGENLPNIQLERLQNENKELKDNVITLIKENKTLKSNGELLNIRLSSLNEILSIQEKEVSRSQGEHVTSGGNHETLLNRWRQKVFALMVQLKSQHISQERDKQDIDSMVQGLVHELGSSKNEIDILSHTLNDRNAELQIQTNTTASLRHELEQARAKEVRLETCIGKYKDAIQGLYDYVYDLRLILQQQVNKINDAFESIAVLSQRINFAAGRVQFLQGLLAHKEAHWKLELNEALKGKDTNNTSQDESKVESSLPYQQLLTEVEKLMSERDMLAAKVAKDAELIDSRADAIRAEYEVRLESSSHQISQLKSELSDEKQRCAALVEKQEVFESEIKEARETIDIIKTDLAKHQTAAEKTLDQALAEERARFTEEFAKMEKQFNEVRREHTKAVVALRQAERQVTREQEKAKEQMGLQEKISTSEMKKCRDLIRSLEQEKNMLLATVRQEGLKMPRVKPKAYMSSPDESDDNSDEKENTENMMPKPMKGKSSRTRTKGDRKCTRNTLTTSNKPNNPAVGDSTELDASAMVNVLKDLQSLSAVLLTMDNEGNAES